jgi:hypothetical protein
MCVDAVQFAGSPLAAPAEFRRVLAPGARLALSCWEAARLAGGREADVAGGSGGAARG